MDNLFDSRGYLKKDADPEKIQQFLELPSGSEDEYSDCDDSDDDPTVNPSELPSYISSDSDSSTDDEPASATLSCPTAGNSKKGSSKCNDHVTPQTTQDNRNVIDCAPQPSQNARGITPNPKRFPCNWKRKNILLPDDDKKFKGNLDYTDEITNLETPFQFVKYFLTDELIEKIINESMLYTTQKDPTKVFQITKSDLYKYIGICLLTSVTHHVNIRDLWTDIIGLQLVKNTMSLNNFEKIRASLHFNNNEKEIPRGQPGHDKLYKIRPVIESLFKTFSSIRMDECLSIDEQMCATKVRHHL